MTSFINLILNVHLASRHAHEKVLRNLVQDFAFTYINDSMFTQWPGDHLNIRCFLLGEIFVVLVVIIQMEICSYCTKMNSNYALIL